jgi:repressor LexA
MHMPLTPKQRAILAFIRERIDADGLPPSQPEIAEAFDFQCNSTALYHLRALEDAGVIERTPNQARGIRLMSRRRRHRPDQLQLPVLGRVAAGAPIGADAGIEEQLLLDRNCFEQTPDYLLRIVGDSMREDGIFDGDLVAIKRTPEARTGQIVVARIDEEITIKRLKLTKHAILLLPRNPDYAPIRVPDDADFAIEGIYCGLVRRGG